MKKEIYHLITTLLFIGISCCLGCCSIHHFFNSNSQQICDDYPLGIIGEVEPVFIEDIQNSFSSRIDTGATTSSIHANKITEFERDHKPWIAFDLILPDNTTITISKPIIRKVRIKRPNKNELRFTIHLTIKMGTETFTEEFTLSDRQKMEYPVLIGRNILSGRAIVDVNKRNTLGNY